MPPENPSLPQRSGLPGIPAGGSWIPERGADATRLAIHSVTSWVRRKKLGVAEATPVFRIWRPKLDADNSPSSLKYRGNRAEKFFRLLTVLLTRSFIWLCQAPAPMRVTPFYPHFQRAARAQVAHLVARARTSIIGVGQLRQGAGDRDRWWRHGGRVSIVAASRCRPVRHRPVVLAAFRAPE